MICLHCNNNFTISRFNKGSHKFCSIKCREEHYTPKYKYICRKCGNEFFSKFKTTKFCSRKCYLGRHFKIINGLTYKECSICKEFKILSHDYFYKSSSISDGFAVHCIECAKEKSKKRNGNQKHIDRCKKYKIENKNKISAYYSRSDIKQRNNLNEAIRKKNDSHLALKCRMRILMYASIRKVKDARSWQSIVGYSVNDLRLHIESLFTDGMNWQRFMNGEIHIDHKLPVSSFNYKSTEDEEFQKCWALANLQPMWAADNIRKSNKIIKEGELCHIQESLQS